MTTADTVSLTQSHPATAYGTNPARTAAKLLAINLGIALIYFLSGKVAIASSYFTGLSVAIWPASGLALGFALLYGDRVIPGVFFGSILVHLTNRFGFLCPGLNAHSIVESLMMGAGACIQARSGAWLIKRFVGFPNSLTRERDVFWFLLLGGPVASILSVSWDIGWLLINGELSIHSFLFRWWTWWIGASIGVIIFTPLLLICFAKPRQLWAGRVISVGLPLCVTLALAVLGFFLADEAFRSVQPNEYLMAHPPLSMWTAMAGGLLFTGLLGGLLLMLTGRTIRIEEEVAQRTAALSLASAQLQQGIDRLRASELARNASDARLELALEASQIGLWELQFSTHQITYSPSWCGLLGYELDKIEPTVAAFNRLVHPEDKARIWENLSDHLEGRTSTFNDELRMRHGAGDWVWTQIAGRVVERDSAGHPIRAAGTLKNITERKRVEMELKMAKLAADAASNAKSAFLANISHEIRTPLTAVIGFSEILLGSSRGNLDQKECLQTIRRNARHLLELINDVLDLSRIESETFLMQRLPIDLPALIGEVATMMRPHAEAKGLFFKVSNVTPIPRQILGDSLRFRQILVNLLGNAVKFTEMGGIRISLFSIPAENVDGRPVSEIRIEIADTGIGMTPEHIRALFTPFSQADESKTRRFGGSGLGLAISRRLAVAMDGDISVKSEPGIGSIFTLKICAPLAGDGEMISEFPVSVPAPEPPPKPIELTGKVLVVEDGRDNQRLISHLLSESGAQVTIAENGRDAINLANANSFDVILMDMQMPVLDGYAATAQLRANGFRLPIIALTAHAMAEDRNKCLEAGCTDYIAKPIEPTRMLELVRKYLPFVRSNTSIPDTVQPVSLIGPPQNGKIRSTIADNPQFKKILPEYIAGLPAVVVRISRLYSSRQSDELRQVIHQLKGSGGSYGFAHITKLAGDIEAAFKEGRHHAIQPSIEELLNYLKSIEGYIEIQSDGLH